MEGFFNGRYKLKRFSCINNIFNVVNATVYIGSDVNAITDGYYTATELATAVQDAMRLGAGDSLCSYDYKTDKFTCTTTQPTLFSEHLYILLGYERQEFTGTFASTLRPNLAPYSKIKIAFSSTRSEDTFILTSSAQYGKRVEYIPVTDKEIVFFSARNPIITATSRGVTFEILEPHIELEEC